MTNTADEPVKILGVDKSCTCASYSLGKNELAPGGSTTLTMNVDVNNTYMRKSASCMLRTDHGRFKDWVYTIEFISLRFAVADPDVLNLGQFGPDDQNLENVHRATLDLFADSEVGLTRDNFTVPEELELALAPERKSRRLQRGVWNTRYEISVGLSPKGRETVLEAFHTGLVNKTIELKAGPKNRWQYTVFWQARAPLEVHPEYVSFGNLSDGAGDRAKKLLISSTTNENFRIVSVKDRSGAVPIEFTVDTPDEAPKHWVTLQIPRRNDGADRGSADGPRRFLSGTIQIGATDKRRPIVEVPWSAMMDTSAQTRPRSKEPKSASEHGI